MNPRDIKTFLNSGTWPKVFTAFTVAYAAVILIYSRLAPIDDFIFLRTLQAGKFILYYAHNFPYYDFLSQGRFMPLLSMEYNLFGLFFDAPSPFWYFLFHAIQFFAFMLLMTQLIKKTTSNKWFIFGIPILIMLIPGVTTGWIRLQNAERNVLFYFAALFLSYSTYLEKRKLIYAILTVLAAGLAIYSKETAFIAVSALALSHLFFSWKTRDKKVRLLDYALCTVGLSYVLLYIFYVIPNMGPTLYAGGAESFFPNRAMVFVRNFINYTFFSDPILILLIIPLFFKRIYLVFIKNEQAHPIYDSFLMGGAAYILAFLIGLNFAFGMFVSYYLAPAYALSIPPLLYFTRTPLSRFWKILLGAVAIIMIANIIPSGIHTISHYKYTSINFNKTLDFLVKDVQDQRSIDRADIFIDGVDRGDGRTVYFILAEYLRFRGLEDSQFDLKSPADLPTNAIDYGAYTPRIPLPFSVFRKTAGDEIKSGDYLVIGPQSYHDVSDKYIEDFLENYTLAFRTKSSFAVPNLDGKALIKYAAVKFLPQEKRNFLQSENIAEWPDYYIFVKK